MATFTLTDLSTSLEAVVFSRSYEEAQPKLVEGAIVLVDAKLDASDGRIRLITSGIYKLDEADSLPTRIGNGKRNGKSNGNSNPQTSDPFSGLTGAGEAVTFGPPKRIRIRVERSQDRERDLARLEEIYSTLQRFRGNDEVELVVHQGIRDVTVPLPNRLSGYCSALASELARLVDAANVWVDGMPVAS